MIARVRTSALTGIDAVPVEVEARVQRGKPCFAIIGLGDSAVREAKDRVATAIVQCGLELPQRVLVNLAPAELRKEGSAFDLSIAIAILASSRQISLQHLDGRAFHGELGLDGRIKPVRGIVAFVIAARVAGAREVIVPQENFEEAAIIEGIEVIPITSLVELLAYLKGVRRPNSQRPPRSAPADHARGKLNEVIGQEYAKRALQIAAAGGHNLLMIGAPGCGKSMLAQRFASILPPLNPAEQLEALKIHSIAGLPLDRLLAGERPFRSPHHAISEAGLVGGGSPQPRPGEISLAHCGVLFLDEFPEYRRCALEALRAPLEGGRVRISRARASLEFPASFQLIAAMNPCPCGRFGTAPAEAAEGETPRGCTCSSHSIEQYLRKLSQPILDRIDLHIEMEAVPFAQISAGQDGATPDDGTLQRVLTARDIQTERSNAVNAQLDGQELRRLVPLHGRMRSLLERAASRTGMSARGYVRVLRVARTIADIEQVQEVSEAHVAEALGFRCLERLKAFF